MAKKTKSKSRLDKFYKIAKEQGYRSRASFKLIQLNKKYNFLQKATVVIDLCAAPGGWLQVAAKYMPSSSIILGLDLDPIKPIPNVKSFQCDITTPECIQLIKREIRHLKVDIVLNDGAPNVGGSWSKDAYTQSELVMYAIKLATQVLKKDGIFVTKIFRSTDYNNLIWLMNKFFDKVEANKPEASRASSAEIFVVCLGYKAPDVIDPRFFDPKYIFKNSENDLMMARTESSVNSIKKIFEIKKRRSIPDSASATLHKSISLNDFLRIENPYAVFVDYNRIILPENKNDLLALPPLPLNFLEICNDLKLLNKKDVASIIRWRGKACESQGKNKIFHLENQTLTNSDKDNKEIDLNNKTLLNENEKKIRKLEKQDKKIKEKQLMKYVKSKLGEKGEKVGGDVPLELEGFDFGNYVKELRSGQYLDIDNLNNVINQENKQKITKETKFNTYTEMNDNIEYLYELKKKKEMLKEKPNIIISKNIVDTIKYKQNENIENNKSFDFIKKDSDKNLNILQHNLNKKETIDLNSIQKKSKWFNKDIFNVLNKNNEKIITVKSTPSILKKTIDDIDENIDESVSEIEQSVNNEYLKNQVDQINEQKINKYLEAPVEEFNLNNMNDNDLCEMIALSKKMLRKKSRREIIDASYNKNNEDDPVGLPSWFVEDEKKIKKITTLVTKEEIEAEKARLETIGNRLPKKVMEAKFRKKKRMINALKKAKGEANEVLDNEGLSPFTKARSINRIYGKAIKKSRPNKKNVIVSQKYTSAAPNRKSGRKFALVDRRLKKDVKNPKKITIEF